MKLSATINKVCTVWANLLSLLFNPFFFSIYCLLIMFTSPTTLSYISREAKFFLLSVVVLNNTVLPLLLTLYLNSKRESTEHSEIDKSERVAPIFISAIFYGLTYYILIKFNVPLFFLSFFKVAAIMCVIAGIFNFWRKISLHSFCMGGIVALIVVLSIEADLLLYKLLLTTLVTTGMVMSSRVWLDSETECDIWIGFIVAAVGLSILLYIV